MEFSRIGEHAIKCVISEDEIQELGFTLDEIMSNGERTQEFMNHIFELAEEEFQIKFELGIKTVRAEFMPDHTLSLTFSEHPGAGGMVEHLKDIFHGLLNSIPKEKLENVSSYNEQKEDENARVIVIYTFHKLETIMCFSKLIDLNPVPKNALYKHEKKYFLLIDVTERTEDEVLRLSVLADEFASHVEVGSARMAFLKEHGIVILKEQAIEQLKEV